MGCRGSLAIAFNVAYNAGGWLVLYQELHWYCAGAVLALLAKSGHYDSGVILVSYLHLMSCGRANGSLASGPKGCGTARNLDGSAEVLVHGASRFA